VLQGWPAARKEGRARPLLGQTRVPPELPAVGSTEKQGLLGHNDLRRVRRRPAAAAAHMIGHVDRRPWSKYRCERTLLMFHSARFAGSASSMPPTSSAKSLP